MSRCRKKTEFGRCHQDILVAGVFCTAHRHFADTGRIPDKYWHEKLVKGLIVPTTDWMTASELHAVLNGRYRGDGRRIDPYIAGDPLLIDPDGFR